MTLPFDPEHFIPQNLNHHRLQPVIAFFFCSPEIFRKDRRACTGTPELKWQAPDEASARKCASKVLWRLSHHIMYRHTGNNVDM